LIELVPVGTHIDFIGKWKACVVGSLVLIAIGLALVPYRLRFGIDFAGGWEIQLHFGDGVAADEGALRRAMGELGISGASVVRFGSDREYLVRFGAQEGEEAAPDVAQPAPAAAEAGERAAADTAEVTAGTGGEGEAAPVEAPVPGVSESALAGDTQGQLADRIFAALQERFGDVSLERVEFVGPRVGAELRSAGIKALLIAGLLILVYIAFRFTVRFAPGAIAALFHDVLVTSSLWILMGREFDLQVLAALLAIVGYSLNDTIIVYDRIRENMGLRTTTDLPEVLNSSVNQTLSRTVLTSATTLVAVLSLLFVGGEVIRPFALAMTIGIVVGTYSSIYIASPVLLWLERRYGARPAAGRGAA
jgi:preprotein translocase subunit SecF